MTSLVTCAPPPPQSNTNLSCHLLNAELVHAGLQLAVGGLQIAVLLLLGHELCRPLSQVLLQLLLTLVV